MIRNYQLQKPPHRPIPPRTLDVLSLQALHKRLCSNLADFTNEAYINTSPSLAATSKPNNTLKPTFYQPKPHFGTTLNLNGKAPMKGSSSEDRELLGVRRELLRLQGTDEALARSASSRAYWGMAAFRMCKYSYMHTYIYIHTYIYTHTYMHTCIHTYIHTCRSTYIRTHKLVVVFVYVAVVCIYIYTEKV